MSAHVLLNLLNELGRDKIRGLLSILSLFRYDFNKFSNTAAKILHSFIIRHQNYFKITFLRVKMSRFCHLLRNVIMDLIT